jgi:hypothetical protein
LKPTLSKRLASYITAASAAGMGILACATTTEAKIVYTRVNVPLGFGTAPLDLNNDGIADFGICLTAVASGNTTYCAPVGRRRGRALPEKRPPGFEYTLVGIWPALAASKQNRIWAKSGSAYALPAGVSVGGKIKFTPGAQKMAHCSFLTPSTTFCGGPWYNALHRYLGLRFVIHGAVHYGWARLTVTGCCSATLTGYAYETTPNKSIVTGNIVGAEGIEGGKWSPEGAAMPQVLPARRVPASLGWLAAGVPGLVAWRKEDRNE